MAPCSGFKAWSSLAGRVNVTWIRAPTAWPSPSPSRRFRTVDCGSRCGGAIPFLRPSAVDSPDLPNRAVEARATCSASADPPAYRELDAKGWTCASLPPEVPSSLEARSARRNVRPDRSARRIPPERTCTGFGKDVRIRHATGFPASCARA